MAGKNIEAGFDQWLNVFERVLEREVLEETGLKIKNIGYVSNIAFERSDGFITFVISLYAEHSDGEVKLDNKALVDYAWVNASEIAGFDCIQGIAQEVEETISLFRNI